MAPKIYPFIFFIIFYLPICTSYNILVLIPYSGVSHFIVYEPLFKELARRGHNMTVMSHFPLKEPMENYHDISLYGLSEIFLEKFDVPIGKKVSPITNYLTQFRVHRCGIEMCNELLGTPQVQSLLKYNNTFDLIIQEHFNGDCFFAFNHIFKVPQVALSSCTLLPWEFDIMGVPMNPSYNVVNLLTFSEKMSFFERVQNTVAFLIQAYVIPDLVYRREIDKIIKKHFGEGIPPVKELAKNTDILLVNSHFTINRPKPFPPNIIEVSGLHLGELKPLPKEIKTFLDEAKYGAIYFSLGSTVKGSTLSIEYRKMMIEVFAKLPQRILWKYENDTLPGKSDNIMIKKWMPQFDVLAHPNIKAFISHCGLLGVIETVHLGVPIICIPFVAEQNTNAKLLAMHGQATVLDAGSFTEEDLMDAIQFALDSKTQKKAKLIQKYYNDRPMSALDTAVWWVEYVARNGGAEAMRSTVLDMPLYQTMLLDVGLFLISLTSMLFYLIYKIFKISFRIVLTKSTKQKTA